MKTIILLYYEDVVLGDYFVKCAAYIKGYLEENYPDAEIKEIKDHLCNQLYVETRLSRVNSEEFLFVSYCHGSKDSFYGPHQDPLIKVNENDHLLKNGFVFSNSCFSGAELGPALIKKGAMLFVGFNDRTDIYPGYSEIFAVCDNYPIILFFMRGGFCQNEKTELEKKIKNFYNQQIDKLYKKCYFAASRLEHNRNTLVLYFKE